MKNIFLPFQQLSPNQLYDILKLRQEIFIIEQNCIYNDIDDYDKTAIHCMISDANQIIGYSRIFEPGIKYQNESSIGRILVQPNFRGNGFGEILIKTSVDYCINNFSKAAIKIEAQAALENYYNALGFQSISKIYPVDGIDHIEMHYTTNR